MTGEINDEQIGRMSKTVFRFCLSRTGSYHDAEDLAQEICEGAVNRIDGISRIMKEYAPEHLADYAGKLPALIQMKEAETIMRMLCEDGWLLPLKNCLATTVMMRNK